MKHRGISSLVTMIVLLPTLAFAQKKGGGLRLAISQGVSSPNVTSPVNISSGYVRTNPAGAALLDGVSLSLEYGTSDENGQKSSTSGAELGVGSGNAGIALGYAKHDDGDSNTNEKGYSGGIAGASFSNFAVGMGFMEGRDYSLGLLINPQGEHRFGLSGRVNEQGTESDLDDIKAFAAGYSYVAQNVIFAIDASKLQGSNQDVILVSPGLQVMADWLALSVTRNIYTNDKNDVYNDGTWFGLGFGKGDMHLAVYHDYFHEWSAVGTYWF